MNTYPDNDEAPAKEKGFKVKNPPVETKRSVLEVPKEVKEIVLEALPKLNFRPLSVNITHIYDEGNVGFYRVNVMKITHEGEPVTGTEVAYSEVMIIEKVGEGYKLKEEEETVTPNQPITEVKADEESVCSSGKK